MSKIRKQLKILQIFVTMLPTKSIGWLLLAVSFLLVYLSFVAKSINAPKDIFMLLGYFVTIYSWTKGMQEWLNAESSNWVKSTHAIFYAFLLELIGGLLLILWGNQILIHAVIDFYQSNKLWALNLAFLLLPLGLANVLEE